MQTFPANCFGICFFAEVRISACSSCSQSLSPSDNERKRGRSQPRRRKRHGQSRSHHKERAQQRQTIRGRERNRQRSPDKQKGPDTKKQRSPSEQRKQTGRDTVTTQPRASQKANARRRFCVSTLEKSNERQHSKKKLESDLPLHQKTRNVFKRGRFQAGAVAAQ